jgi:hypothetical protein
MNMNKLDTDLAQLGPDPLTIANRLYALGIRGNREDTCGCPLGNYLSAEWEDVYVQGDKAKAFMGNVEVTAVLPKAVQEFLSGFDHGHFPELTR